MRILTAGCRRFRDPILLNIEQANRFGYDTTVYDLGGLNIDSAIDNAITDAEFIRNGRYHRVAGIGYAAKSLHKGDIVAKCISEHPNDIVVYMDGDAVMSQNVDDIPDLLAGCDIGLTLRDIDDIERSLKKRNGWDRFLGVFNAGVIIFNKTEKAKEFVEKWSTMIIECQSDQRALNELVNPNLRKYQVGDVISTPYGKVKCLDGAIYNYGYWPMEPDETVRILHFKGLRFRGSIDRIAAICRDEPRVPLRGYESDYEGYYEDIQWEPHSITNVEGYYWWSLIAKYKPDVVLESGICKGRSTHFIAEAVKRYNIPYHIAMERSTEQKEYIMEKFKDYDIEYYYGQNSDDTVKKITKKIHKYRTLLIVDGPKAYDQSMRLYQAAKSLNIVAIGVHDCSPAGGCAQALKDARNHFWKRSSLCITSQKDYAGLQKYNEPIMGDLQLAYEKSKDHWSKKVGRELSLDDYIDFLCTVGICEIEGK